MATFNKFNAFTENVAEGVHNLGSDTLKVYLTNAAPDAAADSVKADLAEISAGNGYVAGGETPTIDDSSQAAGVYKLTLGDVSWSFTGPVGPFRYAVLYNDSPTSPADPLIGWWDFGASNSYDNGDSFTVDFSAANGVLTLT